MKEFFQKHGCEYGLADAKAIAVNLASVILLIPCVIKDKPGPA